MVLVAVVVKAIVTVVVVVAVAVMVVTVLEVRMEGCHFFRKLGVRSWLKSMKTVGQNPTRTNLRPKIAQDGSKMVPGLAKMARRWRKMVLT